MASDRDLADADRDELINKGKQLVDQLSPTSTGRFIAPLGGSYLDMRRIHQSQIKQGLQMILDDLKKVMLKSSGNFFKFLFIGRRIPKTNHDWMRQFQIGSSAN